MVALRQIKELSRRIAEEYKPRRIILFGSYAYGRPKSDSDVDLLVVMRYSGHPVRKSIEILRRLKPSFWVDLHVHSPREVRTRIAQHDWFMIDIVQKGKLLYEAQNSRVGRKGRG